ncbi:unnamed protein product, partial [Prorocentrum cordatum]
EEMAAWAAREAAGPRFDLHFGLRAPAADGRGAGLRVLRFLRGLELSSGRAQGRALAAGLLHSVVVREGVAHTWGAATSGQLGRGSPAELFQGVPTAVPILQRVAMAACGGDHSLLVTDCGLVWAFGRNSHGQLGCNGCRDASRPARVPVPRAVLAACGADHSLVLAADGEVWACGRGTEGQLGTPLPEGCDRVAAPQCTMRADLRIRFVACGADHSVVVDSAGRALGFGENSHGQLGSGHFDCQREPTPLPLPRGCLALGASCGGAHTLLLTDAGRLLGCGSNRQGQLGAGEAADRPVAAPVLLSEERGAVVSAVSASCGFGHSLVLARGGAVWVLGSGRPSERADTAAPEPRHRHRRRRRWVDSAAPEPPRPDAAAAGSPTERSTAFRQAPSQGARGLRPPPPTAGRGTSGSSREAGAGLAGAARGWPAALTLRGPSWPRRLLPMSNVLEPPSCSCLFQLLPDAV